MPSHTTAWLDYLTELSTNMTEHSSDSNSDRHLFKVLGALGSDVKHSLSLLERSRQDTTQLRLDIKQDTHDLKAEFKQSIDQISNAHRMLETRVEKIEQWQTRMMAYMTILIPASIMVGQAIAPKLLQLF